MPEPAVIYIPDQAESRLILQCIAQLAQNRQRIKISMNFQKHLNRIGGPQGRSVTAQRGDSFFHAAHYGLPRLPFRKRVAEYPYEGDSQFGAQLQRQTPFLQRLLIFFRIMELHRRACHAQLYLIFLQQTFKRAAVFRPQALQLFHAKLISHAAQLHGFISHLMCVFYDLPKAPPRASQR